MVTFAMTIYLIFQITKKLKFVFLETQLNGLDLFIFGKKIIEKEIDILKLDIRELKEKSKNPLAN